MTAMPSSHPILQRSARPAAGLLLLALVTSAAQAHTGADGAAHHGADFFAGLLHPWTGLDHLAAMLAVGLWSGMTARRSWIAPLAFAAMLLAGALPGVYGLPLPLPAVEPMVAGSVLVLGLLLATQSRLPAAAAAALVGAFAMFHGAAHGAELSGATQPFAPLAGMVLSTLALHTLGIAGGLALRGRAALWPRLAGGAIALGGGALLLQQLA